MIIQPSGYPTQNIPNETHYLPFKVSCRRQGSVTQARPNALIITHQASCFPLLQLIPHLSAEQSLRNTYITIFLSSLKSFSIDPDPHRIASMPFRIWPPFYHPFWLLCLCFRSQHYKPTAAPLC